MKCEVNMYYHASPVEGIRQLEPRISNHSVPLVYFSKKRENVQEAGERAGVFEQRRREVLPGDGV